MGPPSGPPRTTGITPDPGDSEINRLENMQRDGLDPRLPGFASRAVRLGSGNHVFVLRIPQSWAGPHMVTFKQHSRFYCRNSAGKYALDVAELRAAFALAESGAQRIRQFRTERIGRIVASETPVPLVAGAAIVLHLLPVSAFTGTARRDLLSEGADAQGLATLSSGFYDWRYNFDGVLVRDAPDDKGCVRGYTQLFRNGPIEAVNTSILDWHRIYGGTYKGLIPSLSFEERIIHGVRDLLGYLDRHGVQPPTLIMLTLTGVRGLMMAVSSGLSEGSAIDRDTLLIPDVLYDGTQLDIPSVMKPCFDPVWNACGFAGSLSYDEAGHWSKR